MTNFDIVDREMGHSVDWVSRAYFRSSPHIWLMLFVDRDDVVFGSQAEVRSRRTTRIKVTYYDVIGLDGQFAAFESFTLQRPRRDQDVYKCGGTAADLAMAVPQFKADIEPARGEVRSVPAAEVVRREHASSTRHPNA